MAAAAAAAASYSKSSKSRKRIISSSSSSNCRRCAFTLKVASLVKEQRAKFYIVRRCVTMLICWREHRDDDSDNRDDSTFE